MLSKVSVMVKRWLPLLLFVASIRYGEGSPPEISNLMIVSQYPIENVVFRDTFTVECLATGTPTPNYSWRKDGKVLKDNDDNGRIRIQEKRLTISKVEYIKDSGNYQCLASNSDGTALSELKVEVFIFGKFLPPNEATADRLTVQVTIGKDMVIKCPSHSPARPEIYIWGKIRKKQTVLLVQQDRRVFVTRSGDLVFAHVLPKDIDYFMSSGGFSCLMYNNGIYESSRTYVLESIGTIDVKKKPTLMAYMRENEIAMRGEGKRITCGAIGRPTPMIKWYRDGVEIKKVKGAQLNFDGYALQSDGIDLVLHKPGKENAGKIKCVAINSEGEDSRECVLSVQYKPDWVKVLKPETLSFGDSSTLNCTADAIPSASYEWYKNGKQLVSSDRVIVKENIVKVTSVLLEDKGIFTCLARNVHGAITSQASITTAAVPPKFKASYPDPMYFFRGRTNTIKCNPEGGPEPTIMWYKGSVKLVSTTGRVRILKDGSLQINKTEEADAGSYKCFAVNVGGSAESVADVKVVEPTVITVGPQKRTVKEGFPYYLLCDANYDKKLELKIQWYKNGKLFTSFDDRVALEKRITGPARVVVIRKTELKDAGKWSCRAYTETVGLMSEDWAHAQLQVSAPPDPPNYLSLSSNCSDFETTLNWQLGAENEDYISHFIIEYSSDYEDDKNSWYIYNDTVRPGTTISMKLEKLTPYARLRFRIRAVNSVGPSKPSASTDPKNCITPAAAPHFNPATIRAEKSDPDKLVIVWDPVKKIHQNAPGFQYEIGYRRVGSNKWERKNVSSTTTKYEISSAGYFKEYEVYVRSYNKKGAGPDPTIFKFYSGQNKPTAGPSNVKVSRDGSTDVEITWDPVKVVPPGNIGGYYIYYWTTSQGSSNEVSRKRRAVPNLQAKRKIVLAGPNGPFKAELTKLKPARQYTLVMTAFNSGGEGPGSDKLVFATKEAAPGVPHDVTMTIYGDVVHMKWKPPLSPNGNIISYFIDTNPVTKEVVVDGLEREYFLTGLEPVKYYQVGVKARNNFGPGLSYKQWVAVSLPDKPGKSRVPLILPRDSESVNATYLLPEYGGFPVKYRMCYQPKGGNGVKCTEQEFPKNATFPFVGLDKIDYEFWSIGINSLGEGAPSDKTVAKPLPVVTVAPRVAEAPRKETTPWYKSSWLIGLIACIVFLLIILIVIIFLLNRRGGKYAVGKREKERAGWNGQPMNDYSSGDPYGDYDTQPLTNDKYNKPPPKYSSQGSVEKKEPPSDDNDSMGDYGEDIKFNEDGSFIGQYGDEKRKSMDLEKEEDVDHSTFV